MSTNDYNIAVIGAGGAGTMAYLRSVLNCDKTVLFTGNADTKRKGRATWVNEVDNIPGMHDIKKPITRTGKDTLKWIKEHPDLNGYGEVIPGKVERIERNTEGFTLHYSTRKDQASIKADYIVLATGIMDVQPSIQGSIQPILPYANAEHAMYCIRCDGHKTIGDTLSIIGDKDSAVYIAALMHERYQHQNISILTNGKEPTFSEEAQKLYTAYNMQLYTAPILEIKGDPKVALEGYQLEDGQFVQTNRTIVALGSIVYNDLIKPFEPELADDGRVITSEQYESSIPGIYIVGDLVANSKMQIYTAWEEAVVASEAINRKLRLKKRQDILEGKV